MLRLLTVTLGVLIVTAIAWVAAREYAKSKVRPSREHAFNTGNLPEIIAHRGGALEAPENTLEAFSYAASLDPAVAFELDVRLTRDNQLVVFHDEHLERTTDGSGRIRERTLDELKKLDAGFRFQTPDGNFSYRGRGVKIPTLEEVLTGFSKTRIIIEIKDEIPNVADQVVKAVKAAGMEKLVMIASEHGRMVNEARRNDAELITGASRDEILRSLVLEEIQLGGLDPMKADAYCIPEFHGKTRVLSEKLLTSIRSRKKPVFIWTVNDEAEMKRLVGLGVDGLITDRPRVMLDLKKTGSLALNSEKAAH